MKYMKYKMAVFDLDGTLLNTLEDLADAVNYSLAQFGMPQRTIEEVRNYVGNGIRLLIERSVPNGTDLPVIDNVFECFKKYYQEHCNDKTKAYDGIIDMLKELKQSGIKLAVLSNKAQNAVTKLCDIYFDNLLDITFGAREGIAKKPAPDALLECAAIADIALEDIAYIGDSDVDVLTARNAGVDCIAVSWGFMDKGVLIKAGADKIADNIQVLKAELL